MIPLIRPLVPQMSEAMGLFQSAALSGQLTNFGDIHEDLTQRLQELSGGYAVPVSTGTAAIEVALGLLGFEPGDRVALPDFTHSGTILAIVRAGLTPVLMGVDPKTWTLRPEEVEKAALENRIQGAVVVSPFGYSVDTLTWDEVKDKTGLGLVYDFAGAFGHFPRTISPVCYSFHATKNFGVGEGGMILLRSERQARDARRLSNFDTMPNREIGSLRGSNSKVDELKAAFLLAGLDHIVWAQVLGRIESKRQLLDFYQKNLPGTYVPPGKKHPSLCVLGNLPAERLEYGGPAEGAVMKRYYPLLSEMPALSSVERLSVSDEVMKNCCALPSDATMEEALEVIKIIGSFL